MHKLSLKNIFVESVADLRFIAKKYRNESNHEKFIKFVRKKMPKIFEYLGIIIFFYSNKHEPIHVHAKKGEYESKAEFIISGGKIVEIKIQENKGFKPLNGTDLKNFKDFLSIYADKIVNKWIDYFVYRKDIEFERITKKVK